MNAAQKNQHSSLLAIKRYCDNLPDNFKNKTNLELLELLKAITLNHNQLKH